MTEAALIVGFLLSGLLFMWFVALTAPVGYEDEDGFHLMEDDEDD